MHARSWLSVIAILLNFFFNNQYLFLIIQLFKSNVFFLLYVSCFRYVTFVNQSFPLALLKVIQFLQLFLLYTFFTLQKVILFMILLLKNIYKLIIIYMLFNTSINLVVNNFPGGKGYLEFLLRTITLKKQRAYCVHNNVKLKIIKFISVFRYVL